MLAFSVLCPTTPPSSSTLSPSPALFIPITGASSSHLSFSSQALSPASRSADQATYQHLHFGVIQTVTIDTPKPAPLGHHLRKWDHSPSSCTIRIQLLPPLTHQKFPRSYDHLLVVSPLLGPTLSFLPPLSQAEPSPACTAGTVAVSSLLALSTFPSQGNNSKWCHFSA
jgi:hypothetical protein